MSAEDIIKSLCDFSQKAEKGMLFLFFKQKKRVCLRESVALE